MGWTPQHLFSIFFFGTLESEEPTHNGGQAATLYLPFRKLVQKARESISIPDPAAEEKYKLRLTLECDPLLLHQQNVHSVGWRV